MSATSGVTEAKIRAKWADVRATLLLTEDELCQRLDKRVPAAGVRSRRLMRHAAKTIRDIIALSRAFDKLEREERHASKKSNVGADRSAETFTLKTS